MRNTGWEPLDVSALLKRREEATTSANAGAYPVPLGTPMRNPFPAVETGTSLEQLAAQDPEYARALRSMGWLR